MFSGCCILSGSSHFRWVFLSVILVPMLFAAVSSMRVNLSDADASAENVFGVVMLHYDTYYPSINLTEMHATFEAALSWLRDEGFPMDKVMVVTWRNTFDSESELAWLLSVLEKYNVPVGEGQFGMYMSPEDAHNPHVLSYALETFRDGLGRYPFFVAGFSASSNTYLGLVGHGVKLSFFNLWEEGEEYSYRGYSTGDKLFGANWEGSPFQPYKPSKRTANALGTTKEDELDIWEAHWITRNPSYAFLAINSRNWGSVHPFDLLWKDGLGSQVCESSEALSKLRAICDLIDLNAEFNPVMIVSYPVEVSLLRMSNVFEVWRASMREFMRRGYTFVDAVGLRSHLDSLNGEPPHTPVYVWFDNLTSSDMVVAGEHTPFALLSSPYGRFIYGRRDPLNDSGAPFVSITSYTTARAYNESFQSIRELTGVGNLKMNTFVDGVPTDLRWLNDIATITIVPGKAIAIKWLYTKGEIPYVKYSVAIYLTPYGVLVEKRVVFKRSAVSQVSMVHHFTVQSCSPTPFSDEGVRAKTDVGHVFYFSPNNDVAIERQLQVNDTLMFTARDCYALGVTITSGKPDTVRIFDERGESPFQTLEFAYHTRIYEAGTKLQLSYALTPAKDMGDARKLADAVKTLAAAIESEETQTYTVRSDELEMYLLVLATLLIILMTIVMVKGRSSHRYGGVRCID